MTKVLIYSDCGLFCEIGLRHFEQFQMSFESRKMVEIHHHIKGMSSSPEDL